MSLCLVRHVLISGIKQNKPKRSEEEFNKVTTMVKEKNYNHPEIGVLKESEIQRMKVTLRSNVEQDSSADEGGGLTFEKDG